MIRTLTPSGASLTVSSQQLLRGTPNIHMLVLVLMLGGGGHGDVGHNTQSLKDRRSCAMDTAKARRVLPGRIQDPRLQTVPRLSTSAI